jgi:BASS family bile acid:Na+ symporter
LQADLLTSVILPLSLFLIMYGIGLSLRPADFGRIVTAPRAFAIGVTGQMLLLPAIAFLLATVFGLPGEIAVGLIIIALAPGGATSNMFSYLARGDVSLSITLTAVVSLVTPFTLPLLTALAMHHFMGDSTEFGLPVGKTILQLLVITLIPVALGMFTLARWPQGARRIEQVLKWFSILFLMLIIALIVLKNADNMASFFAQAGAATLVLNLVVLGLGYQLARWGRLSRPQSITIGFEVGIQNGTLALVVAGTLIGNPVMMIPAVTYSLIMFGSGAAFGWLMQRTGNKQTAGDRAGP